MKRNKSSIWKSQAPSVKLLPLRRMCEDIVLCMLVFSSLGPSRAWDAYISVDE